MTPSQTMARTIEISKVDKGKDRAFSPASPDSDIEPTPPIPKTAPKTAKKPNNKSTKNATPMPQALQNLQDIAQPAPRAIKLVIRRKNINSRHFLFHQLDW